ncbi:MAG: PepSY-associated TM helix domain-containing protein [Armatimonadota bacterium]
MDRRLRWLPSPRTGFFRVHQFLGATVGAYWILMAATGSVLLYGETLEQAVHPRWFAVKPEGAPAPLSQLLPAVAKRFPDTPVEDIRLPRHPTDSVMCLLPDPNGGPTREVYVHPRTGAILGHRLESESWLLLAYRIHAELLLGARGESLNGLLALAASALLFTALPLWMPRNRAQWRQRFQVKTTGNRMRLLFDLHNAFGMSALPALATVAATGVYFLYAARLEPAILAATGTFAAPEHALPTSASTALPVDRLRALAEAVEPQARTTWVNLPIAPEKPFRITRAHRGAEGLGHTSEISLDPGDGRVLGVTSARGEPIGRRVVRWMYPLHTASWGGTVAKLVYLASALATIALAATGIAKWRLRSRRKLDAKLRRTGPPEA